MSSAAMNWAFEKIVPNLTDQVVKLVILRLADRADPAGICWPGHKRTARDLNVSTRSVQLSIKKLSELKLIEVDQKKGKVGVIRLQLQNTVSGEFTKLKKPKKKTAPVPRGETIALHTGETSSPQGVKPLHPGGEENAPLGGEAISPESPSFESVINPPLEKEGGKTVVVAKKTDAKSGEMPSIIWPTWLEMELQLVCAQLLDRVDQGRRQVLVDEMAGAASMRPIKSPPSWLRRIIMLDKEGEGGLILEHASSIAAARKAHDANEARLAAINTPKLAQQKDSKNTLSQAFLTQQAIWKQWGEKPAVADPSQLTESSK